MRYFIVGDIHGCYDEFQDLLDAAALNSDDHIISIGDMVNRGPQSGRVLDFFQNKMNPNAYSIMGNHEHKHIRAHRGEIEPALSSLITRWQIGDSYEEAIHYMRGLPLYLELPDALLVHAYFEPNIPLEEQQERILVGTMGATKYLTTIYKKPWWEYYTGDKPIIVGHRDMSLIQQPFVYEDQVYGIETGCVFGGTLTGLLLPDFKFVSVQARDTHWQTIMLRYMEHE